VDAWLIYARRIPRTLTVFFPQRHLLLKNAKPVALGSRAIGLLIALASRPGELLDKK
jgi:DNA-binding winged helix-turn-helix (wHTH) protein